LKRCWGWRELFKGVKWRKGEVFQRGNGIKRRRNKEGGVKGEMGGMDVEMQECDAEKWISRKDGERRKRWKVSQWMN